MYNDNNAGYLIGKLVKCVKNISRNNITIQWPPIHKRNSYCNTFRIHGGIGERSMLLDSYARTYSHDHVFAQYRRIDDCKMYVSITVACPPHVTGCLRALETRWLDTMKALEYWKYAYCRVNFVECIHFVQERNFLLQIS